MEPRTARAFSAWAILFALFATSRGIATAADPGGVSGYVLDRSGQPMRHVAVTFWRPSDFFWTETQTDGRGFFSDVDLEPGRYAVALFEHTAISDYMDACVVRDVVSNEQDRVTLRAGECYPNVESSVHSLVDPDGTEDVYRIQ
ncbi:MAG: carboxypeptidase-like regulatory domain-containing protein [Candidatus Cybelea sp.]